MSAIWLSASRTYLERSFGPHSPPEYVWAISSQEFGTSSSMKTLNGSKVRCIDLPSPMKVSRFGKVGVGERTDKAKWELAKDK